MAHFIQQVTPAWIREQVDRYALEQKELAIAFNVDKSAISNWLNERTNMSKPVRAAFYYYFAAKKLGYVRTA